MRWAAALAVAATLAGCSGSPAPDPREAIPAALIESDIGVVSAEAEPEQDGLATNLFVVIEFDHGDVTSRDLASTLQIIVDNADTARYNYLAVVGRFGGDANTGELLDLATLSEQLGFEPDSVYGEWFHQKMSSVSSTIGSE